MSDEERDALHRDAAEGHLAPAGARRADRGAGARRLGPPEADPHRGHRQHVAARRRLRLEVARRLEGRELPDGVAVIDFGTGGLDLAYQVMYGYDALLMIDISRQGGVAGHALRHGGRRGRGHRPASRTATRSTRTRMDPETVLRFIKLTGGWPGKVVIIACEPLTIEEMGVGLSPVVEEAVDRAVELVLEQAKELLTDEAYASLDEKK